ncbi:MAG: hypothetical protein JRI55_10720 [Deltaproteobacteria bacterium]|jgi:hypothetical protein|nr:hypothetical protein [Deltaproteobacteria bacterium]
MLERRMLRALKCDGTLLQEVAFDPETATRQAAVIVVLLSVVYTVLTTAAALLGQLLDGQRPALKGWFALLLLVLPVWWFCASAALCFFGTLLLGGQGGFGTVARALAFACLPLSIAGPLWLIPGVGALASQALVLVLLTIVAERSMLLPRWKAVAAAVGAYLSLLPGYVVVGLTVVLVHQAFFHEGGL